MTLDEVLALKQEMEAAIQEPPRAGLGLVQRWIDEGRAIEFARRVFDTPARALPVLFETTEPALISACMSGRLPRGDFVHAALVAHGRQDEKVPPRLSVGYSAVGKNDYRAEVRLQDPDLYTMMLTREIVHRTKGQSRIGEYRDLCAHAGKAAESGSEGLLVGSSVGHRKGPAGTLGLFLKSAEGVGLVSNSHVLAWCGRARPGDPIFAPHPDDSKQARQIGKLRHFSNLINDDEVALDAAFALLAKDVPYHGNLVPDGMPDAGKSIKAGEPLPVESIDLKVAKIGRTSHSTLGVVAAFNIDPKITYAGLGEVKLTGMLEVQWPSPKKAFSQPGDSGSVVYRPDTMEAIGLVVGGGVRIVEGVGQGVTIVCPLTPAMKKWSLSPL
jgi:hypothetical protein